MSTLWDRALENEPPELIMSLRARVDVLVWTWLFGNETPIDPPHLEILRHVKARLYSKMAAEDDFLERFSSIRKLQDGADREDFMAAAIDEELDIWLPIVLKEIHMEY